MELQYFKKLYVLEKSIQILIAQKLGQISCEFICYTCSFYFNEHEKKINELHTYVKNKTKVTITDKKNGNRGKSCNFCNELTL